MFKFNYNHMDFSNITGKIFSPIKNGCYIEDCYIKPKKNDKMFILIDDGMNSWLVPTLKGYAIIPRDELDEFMKWKKVRSRVINGG